MFETEVKETLGAYQVRNENIVVDNWYIAEAKNSPFIPISAFRFNGPRESFKFSLIQKNLQAFVLNFLTLADSIVTYSETINSRLSYSTAVLAELAHLRAQIEFQEYLQLKTTKRKWL